MQDIHRQPAAHSPDHHRSDIDPGGHRLSHSHHLHSNDKELQAVPAQAYPVSLRRDFPSLHGVHLSHAARETQQPPTSETEVRRHVRVHRVPRHVHKLDEGPSDQLDHALPVSLGRVQGAAQQAKARASGDLSLHSRALGLLVDAVHTGHVRVGRGVVLDQDHRGELRGGHSGAHVPDSHILRAPSAADSA